MNQPTTADRRAARDRRGGLLPAVDVFACVATDLGVAAARCNELAGKLDITDVEAVERTFAQGQRRAYATVLGYLVGGDETLGRHVETAAVEAADLGIELTITDVRNIAAQRGGA